jgi:hypothetical protein
MRIYRNMKSRISMIHDGQKKKKEMPALYCRRHEEVGNCMTRAKQEPLTLSGDRKRQLFEETHARISVLYVLAKQK